MRRHWGAVAVLAVLGLSLPQTATAAGRFGDNCVGNATVAGRTALVLNNGLGGTPELAPPEYDSVITRWIVEAGPGTLPTAQQLRAFVPASELNDARLVAESAVETVVAGHNEFATRVPVPEYSRIGLSGPEQTLVCDGVAGHIAGFLANPWAIGEAREYSAALSTGVPVVAISEPDRDGDGYGDETQDGCPDNAAVTGPCPIFSLRVGKQVRGKTILIHVTPSAAAQVTVQGQVRWRTTPKRRQGKRNGNARQRRGRLIVVPLRGGGTVAAGADAEAVFQLRLGRGVVRRLSKLPRKRGLQAFVRVSASDELGQPGGHLFKFKVHRTWR